MSDLLKITLVQPDTIWESIDKNLKYLDSVFSTLEENSDIIVLPEMFSTGFTMNVSQNSESMDGKTISWLKFNAKKYKTAITGSFIVTEEAVYYNRLVFVEPEGNISFYDKAHLFRMSGENNIFSRGTKKIVINYNGWRICPLICYDLRFPVWSRNVEDYHLLIYIANWPESRREAWQALLKARAIENQSYCIGVNRKGKDGNDIKYAGNSMIVSPQGEIIKNMELERKDYETIEISMPELLKYKNNFPVYLDADKFIIEKQ